MENQHLQLQSLEKRTRKLERLLRLSVGGWLLTCGLLVASSSMWKSQAQQTPAPAPASLRVSELVVVDSKGVERVRIGGDLPDAIIGGKRVPRGQQAAGVVLYDASGGERSGYVTFEPSGNVGLTLDSRKEQIVSFIAAPDDEAASMLQLRSGKDLIELRSDDEGSRLTAVKAGQVISQQPLIKRMSADMCEVYRGARSRVSSEQVMRDCRQRFTEIACQACLSRR
ncbi:MAG TPA: hypothetical protein VF599_07220 [Pyrinomonadaceae bacterium]|jgi:hypothetical protein